MSLRLCILHIFTIFCSFSSVSVAQAATSGFDIELSRKRCDKVSGTHGVLPAPEVYQSDFHWGYSLTEMAADFDKIYTSGKRIRLPADFDPNLQSFVVYRETSTSVLPVKLTDRFIKNVTLHIEEALQKNFAEFIFFPDMGHSHLYFDQTVWEKEFKALAERDGPEAMAALYESMLASPELYALYHTAEQLQMMVDKVLLDDPHLLFRYWHRNPVGKHDESGLVDPMPVNKDGGYNTVRNLPNMEGLSAGFEVSSSKNGCFAYKTKLGKTLFFDIGLVPLQMDPNATIVDFGY